MSPSPSVPDPHATPDGDAGYERKDANVRLVAGFGIVLAAFVILAMFLLMRVYEGRFVKYRATPEPGQAEMEMGQQMLIHQREQLKGLRAEEDAALSGYGWVDRKAGVVRLPIDRAIELVTERGVPAGKGPKTDVELNSHAGTPASASPAPPTPAADESRAKPKPEEPKK